MNLEMHETKWWQEDDDRAYQELKRQRTQNGESVCDLAMINPDLTPHIFLMDKLLEATLKKENHRYAVSRGVYKLRYAFSKKYETSFSANIDPATEICATFGTKDAVSTFLLSNTIPGQKVLLPDPYYPTHLFAVKFAGLKPFFFKQQKEEAMLEEIANIVVRENIDIIFLDYPSNPTGQVVSREFYEGLYRIVKNKNIIVYNDYAYGEMIYNNAKCPSILSIDGFKDYAVESYTLSKAYNVPGWRVGAMLGNEEVIKKMSVYKSYQDYGIFLAIQNAAASVLTCQQDILSATLAEYQERINFFCEGLRNLGWEVKKPLAGTCVWAKPPKELITKSFGDLSYYILDKANICVTEGKNYSNDQKDFVRFALVRPVNVLEGAIKALSNL